MLPASVPDVPIYAGDTVDFPPYTFQDENDDPLDVSGYSWSAQWRAYPTAKTSIELAVDDTDAATGTVRVSASSEQTSSMTGNGVWDLQAIDGDRVTTWVRGVTVFTKDVTRA